MMTRLTRTRKGIALLIVFAMLALLLPASTTAADSDVRFVRVLLSTESATSLSIPVKGSYTLVQAQRTFQDGTLTITGSGSSVSVTHSAEGMLYVGGGVTIERNDIGRDAGYLTLRTAYGSRNYLGNFSISAYNGVLTVINRVPLSHYLYGVVGYEMSDTFPLEALKAQALAAKGYVLLRMKTTGSYDIGDTSSDQVYKGYDASSTKVISAVDATMGDVLYYNNMPLLCFYAASNGGWMILPSDRWTSTQYDGAYNYGADPYDLANPSTPVESVFVPANYSEKDMGTAAFAFLDARLMAAVAERGVIPNNFYFGGVQSIDSVESSGTAGYPDDQNHTTVTVTATVRANLEEALIPTPTPTHEPTPSPTPTFEPTPSATPTHEPTPSPTPTIESSVTPEGQTPTPVADETPTPTPSATPTHEPTPTPTPTFEPTPSPTPTHEPTPSPTPEIETVRLSQVSTSFTFAEMEAAGLYTSTYLKIHYAEPTSGGWRLLFARYGHGVGMSQRGAQQMANIGKTYREILSFYYPGATLGTMEYTFPEAVADTQPATAETGASTGKVQNGSVNLRAKASTSASVVETLPADTFLALLGMTGEWYYVSAPSGNTGYIRHDYVLLTGSNMIAQGVVSGSAVNYRTGPGTSYSTIGQLSLDTQLGIYGMVDGWYKIKAMTTGTVGFVSGDYVTITQGVASDTTIPTTNEPDITATPTPTTAPTPTPTPESTVEGATPTPVVIGQATPTPTPSATPTATPTPTPGTTIAPEYAAAGIINASGVNIRAGASTTTRSYGKLMNNTSLGLYEKVGSWYRVRVLATGLEGYVYAKYVTMTQTSSDGSGGSSSGSSAGYINASGVNVRTGASTRYNRLGQLSRYTSVKVVGSVGSWYQVEIPSIDVSGYVFAKYVTLTETVKKTTDTGVVTSRLNLRSQPSTSSATKILLTMEKGATVTVYSTANGWCYVNYNGTLGYCIASCVKTD
jgi:peptidoglycan hydrolase-like amidase/uncharacterized protein YgiM (DUF1202 family)